MFKEINDIKKNYPETSYCYELNCATPQIHMLKFCITHSTSERDPFWK